MNTHPRDSYRSLTAARSCSQDDARPHTLLGRALHEKQSDSLCQSSRAPLPPPGASTPNDLRHVQFGQISTCPVLGFRERIVLNIAGKWNPLESAARPSPRRPFLKFRACQRDLHWPWGWPACSRPNQAQIPSCCVQTGVFTTSFRSLVCIKSSLISSE